MAWSRQTWCAALAAGCFLAAPLAEARHTSPPRDEWFEESAPERLVKLGLYGQSARAGSSLDVRFGVEEEHWGIASRLTLLSLKPGQGLDDGRMRMLDAHITYAVAASEKARLRLETGLTLTRIPAATFVGPSLGMSFERCLLGALDMEGRIQWVPLPHLQLEAQLGLSLHLGSLVVRGGWRGLSFNDRGHIDRASPQLGRLSGPFVGMGLAL
ncbi:MAG: hypothetical protein ABW123_19605 [Cystobacter sp.]